ncbi:MAG TPA: hypothetical protein VFG04_20450 [Planctomycetaceae bacterium]|jgi:hypothetical protein|nr:hypothetical protein [Planctomycetaceae bacterium]
MAAQLYVGNDNDVYLQGYRLAATGAPVTNALPSFTVYYDNGISAISGLTNIAMPYTGANGDYRGLIPGTANLTMGSEYYIVVSFSNYNDLFSGWFTATGRTTGSS